MKKEEEALYQVNNWYGAFSVCLLEVYSFRMPFSIDEESPSKLRSNGVGDSKVQTHEWKGEDGVRKNENDRAGFKW